MLIVCEECWPKELLLQVLPSCCSHDAEITALPNDDLGWEAASVVLWLCVDAPEGCTRTMTFHQRK